MFALAYVVKGFTFPIEEMEPDDRAWHLQRAKEQLEREEAAMKKK